MLAGGRQGHVKLLPSVLFAQALSESSCTRHSHTPTRTPSRTFSAQIYFLFVGKMPTRVVILPGNGCTPIETCNWYNWLAVELRKDDIDCRCQTMPDPYVARRAQWLPFAKDELEADVDAVVVGHSSGAEAAMRLAEETKLAGIVLVSACVTDLGVENERASGYYPDFEGEGSNPWRFDLAKQNVAIRVQLASETDPFLPYETEQLKVRDGLDIKAKDFHSFPQGGHFMVAMFPELLAIVKDVVKRANGGDTGAAAQ